MNSKPNPWLTPIEKVDPEPQAPDIEPASATTGPTVPQAGVTAPARGLGVREQATAAGLWIVGAHGGSAESTLAGLAPGFSAAGHAWPLVAGSQSRVLLCCRSSARGLRAAQAAAAEWASGSVPFVDLVGLVVVADSPGRLPRQLRDLIQLVAGGVPRLLQLPWVEACRLGQELPVESLPRELKCLVEELSALPKVPVLQAQPQPEMINEPAASPLAWLRGAPKITTIERR